MPATEDEEDTLSSDESFESAENVREEAAEQSAGDTDNALPPTRDQSDAPTSLESLGVRFVEQNSLERSVAENANKAMAAKDVEVEKKRLKRALDKYTKLQGKVRSMQTRLEGGSMRISAKENLRVQIEKLEEGDLMEAANDVQEIRLRLHDAENNAETGPADETPDGTGRLPDETRQEYLIRTGKVTAFGSANGFIEEVGETASSHQNLRAPGIEELEEEESEVVDLDDDNDDEDVVVERETPEVIEIESEDEYSGDAIDAEAQAESEESSESSDYQDEVEDDMDLEDDIDVSAPKKKKATKEEDDFTNIDDGDEKVYRQRLNQWIEKRSALRRHKRPDYIDDPAVPEWQKPHPTVNDAILNDEFRIPGDIYPSLFDYQKTGVQWLWELYSQRTGGIIGDEMGLGKTVQAIAFLAGLHYSGKLKKPVLVVCPATVMRQWCNEFHRWWPAFRTVILHSIGSGMSGKASKRRREEDELDEVIETEDYDAHRTPHSLMNELNAKELIQKVVKDGHVIITTYVGVRIYAKYLLKVNWAYVLLDEGHKIRNPDSYITISCKQLRTPNRVILSGTPIQNNLVELWSLFDFIYPGRLGTLPVFQKQFCVPINLGGYANATNVQVQTGYKCAVILKDLISPYLLRRLKVDVAQDLPKKSEMVLFCKLTARQRTLYENFLHSEDLQRILKGKRNALYGIDMLRKICNHPDLVLPAGKEKDAEQRKRKASSSKEMAEKSGKLQVVRMLIQLWHKEDRKALVFTQTRIMLDILQEYLDKLIEEQGDAYSYLRMDGTTPIAERQRLMDSFNNDPQYHIFLLTTRVGGLGVNLTGASRVIIYDPDWNPSTDMQARERAWRLGQKKDVTIYRLMIAGSIEEKIYHRQIFKQFLTNKILKDPKQKRFFKMTDMYDLFTLGDQDTKGTETADLFGAKETNFEGTKERRSKFLKGARGQQKASAESDDFLEVSKMRGVAGVQEYDTGEGSKPKGGDTDETGLVSQIFKRNGGVHSALEHESIMQQAGSSQASSYDIIETEANRVAKNAVDALKNSRRAARKSGFAVPTWTGRFGAAGRAESEGQRPKRGRRVIRARAPPSGIDIHYTTPARKPASSSLSSSSILQSMEKRKNDAGTLKPVGSRSGEEKKTQQMVTELSSYMSGVKEFFSTSNDILDHLHIDVDDEKQVKVLRSMLRGICKWDKKKRGWILKDEFR